MKKAIILFLGLFCFISVKSQQVKYYINSQVGQPWGSSSNINCMNTAFGVGIWQQSYFEVVNVNALFQPSVCFIYMDGSDNNANAFNNFIAANGAALQNWVFNGGRLYMNAAPNQGGNINLGFGGMALNYSFGPYSSSGNAAVGMSGLPPFNGPFLPAGTSYSGNYLGQGIITGGLTVPVLTSTAGNILVERYYGLGHMFVGCETTTNWHFPQPNGPNFRSNILSNLGNCCAMPNVSVSAVLSSTAICAGENVTITPSGGAGAYSIWPGGQSGTVFIVSPTVSTNYNVVSTTTAGCQSGVTIRIVVSNTVPNLSVSGNTMVCNGAAISLTASGANTYTWSTGALTNTMSDTPTVSAVYTVVATSSAGCTGTLTQAVQVNPNPNIGVSGNNSICFGSPVNFTASGANSYTWSTGANTSTITDSPNTNTVYTIAGTSTAGCSGSSTISVAVNPTPTLSVNGPTNSICAGNTVTLQANGAGTYSWSNGATSSSIAVSPTVTTIYSVIGSNGGCSVSASQMVTVNPAPSLTVSGQASLCAGQNTTLTVSGANSYSWSNGAFTQSIFVSPPTNTVYSVIGTSSAGCTGNASLTVSVFQNPTVNIGGVNIVCSGATLNLLASGANTYSWSNGALTGGIAVSPSLNTTYSVTGTSTAGCTGTAAISVSVIIAPTVIISGNTVVCNGAAISLTAGGANTYTWSTGAFTNTMSNTPSVSTVYTVVATSTSGCTGTLTQAVQVNPNPVISIAGNSSICLGSSVNFTASGANSFTWSTGASTSTITDSPNTNTVYTVAGTNTAGCIGNASLSVSVFQNPTVNINGGNVSCPGSTLNLMASGANTYSWSNGALTSGIAVSPSVNTTYSVTGTSIAGCTGTAAVNVSVATAPTVMVSGNNTLCAGQSTTLTASGANSYFWNNGSFSSTIAVSPSVSVNYTATGTSNNGCSSAGTIAVIVNALPTVSVAGGGTLCSGQSATLTASGASTYTWDGGSNSNAIIVTPTANTTYSVAGTSAQGCSGNATSVSITVVICTALREAVSFSEIKIFPNPNSGEFTVEAGPEAEKIELSDLSGRIVLIADLNPGTTKINMRDLSSGLYFAKIKSQNGQAVIRLIKN
jgi:hypothetical protein